MIESFPSAAELLPIALAALANASQTNSAFEAAPARKSEAAEFAQRGQPAAGAVSPLAARLGLNKR